MAKVLGMVQHDITLVTRRPKRKHKKPATVGGAGVRNRSAKYRGEPLTHSPFKDLGMLLND